MTQEQINELRKLAEAALWTGRWYDGGCETLMGTYGDDSENAEGHGEVVHPVPLGIVPFLAAVQPAAILALIQQRDELLAALKAAKRAIGDHYAPDDCYATGPLTGDSFLDLDLVQCPACAFLELHAAVTAKCEAKS